MIIRQVSISKKRFEGASIKFHETFDRLTSIPLLSGRKFEVEGQRSVTRSGSRVIDGQEGSSLGGSRSFLFVKGPSSVLSISGPAQDPSFSARRNGCRGIRRRKMELRGVVLRVTRPYTRERRYTLGSCKCMYTGVGKEEEEEEEEEDGAKARIERGRFIVGRLP